MLGSSGGAFCRRDGVIEKIVGVQFLRRSGFGRRKKHERRRVVDGADDDGGRLVQAAVEGRDGSGKILGDGGVDGLGAGDAVVGEQVGDEPRERGARPRADAVFCPVLRAELEGAPARAT